MTPTVSVANFEGPLGLLLELVEANRLEITNIAVAAVTGQYLERVAELRHQRRQNLAEFLELGARLVYIKSLALLPPVPGRDSSELELQQLSQDLADYRQFRDAAATLHQHLTSGKRSFGRQPERLPHDQLPPPQIDLEQLGRLFSQALERAKPLPTRVVWENLYDQAEIQQQLERRLADNELSVHQVVAACRDRAEIIVTFLAVLELVRSGRAKVEQSQLFGDIKLARG